MACICAKKFMQIPERCLPVEVPSMTLKEAESFLFQQHPYDRIK